MQSDRSNSVFVVTQRSQSLAASDARGKHRLQAELKRVEQEAKFLEVSSSLMFHVARSSMDFILIIKYYLLVFID